MKKHFYVKAGAAGAITSLYRGPKIKFYLSTDGYTEDLFINEMKFPEPGFPIDGCIDRFLSDHEIFLSWENVVNAFDYNYLIADSGDDSVSVELGNRFSRSVNMIRRQIDNNNLVSYGGSEYVIQGLHINPTGGGYAMLFQVEYDNYQYRCVDSVTADLSELSTCEPVGDILSNSDVFMTYR